MGKKNNPGGDNKTEELAEVSSWTHLLCQVKANFPFRAGQCQHNLPLWKSPCSQDISKMARPLSEPEARSSPFAK